MTALQLTKFGILSEIYSSGNTHKQLVSNSSTWAELSKNGINVRYSITPVRNEFGLGNVIGHWSKLKQITKPDLVVLHQVYTLSTFHGYRYAKKMGIPYVVFPHGSLNQYNESNNSLIKFIAKKLIIKKILQEAGAIIVTCASESEDLEKSLQAKALLLPYGRPIDIRNSSFEEENKIVKDPENVRILFCGRFHKVKNLPLVLKAMPAILNDYPDLVLDIAGSGTTKELRNLKAVIATLGLENNIEFHGWIDKNKMEQLFRSASVLVLPSENENFALVVSEALSSGVPCVVSQFVGASDIVERHQAGEIIEELTPKSLTAAVLKVLDGDQLAYREAAFKAAREDLDWSKIALKWKVLISSLTVE